MFFGKSYNTHDVFGISKDVLEPSYVDRGALDSQLQILLTRNTHIALRGESKCGKSWIRQKNIPDAITIQCRLHKTPKDLYADALGQLGIRLVTEERDGHGIRGRLEATQEIGIAVLFKLSAKESGEVETSNGTSYLTVGRGLDDLTFISEIINASGRRLVIEDFHYLSPTERKTFAFDLKALWDLGTYVVIIGIWTENNLLIHLNPDLAGRIKELSIYWSNDDLSSVIERGSTALNISLDKNICNSLINDAFGNVGILQTLALGILDEAGVRKTQSRTVKIDNQGFYEDAALSYADQLNALYQTFATRVAAGIRQRKNATGIYAHMLKVVLEAGDEALTAGLSVNKIYSAAHDRESRIQKPNLRQILRKIDKMQVDEHGRGLTISYDENKDEVYVVDKQLLFYRKYATIHWPWDAIIEETTAESFEADNQD